MKRYIIGTILFFMTFILFYYANKLVMGLLIE